VDLEANPAEESFENRFETLKAQVRSSGLPDFSWYNIPKREKYTKYP
jgi:hypothetical protein